MNKKIKDTNLNEVRDQLSGRIKRFHRNSDRSVTLHLTDGKEITLHGIRIQERGSHIILMNRYNDRMIVSSSAFRVKAKWKHSLVYSLIGLLISILFSIIASHGFDWSKTTRPTIEDQIEELDNIKNSLTNLKDYVTSQQRTLKNVSTSLHELNIEKSALETILDTDRKKIDAILAYTGEKKSRWIEWGIAFLIGVFSSLIASLMWHYFRNLRNIVSQENESKT